MLSQLKNSVCAAVLLAGIISAPLTASNTESEESQKIQGMKCGILDDLPEEVLLHILSFTHLQDWGGVSLTCTQFRAIGSDAFKDLQAFKQRFQDIEKILEEGCKANPAGLLEHYTEALKALRSASPLLECRTSEEKEDLGRLIHKQLEKQMVYGRLKNQGLNLYLSLEFPFMDTMEFNLPALKAAALGFWPRLAVSALLMPTDRSLSDWEALDVSKLDEEMRQDLAGAKPQSANAAYLSENALIGYAVEDRPLREVFALIGDTEELQRMFLEDQEANTKNADAAVQNSVRSRLLASELMLRGPEARKAVLKKAQQYFEKRDYDAVLALIEPIARDYSDMGVGPSANTALAYLEKIARNRKEQDVKKAQFYAKKAASMDPNTLQPRIYLFAAAAYTDEKDWSLAMRNFKTAFAKEARFIGSAYAKAGIAFMGGKQFEEAISYFVEAKNRDAGLKAEADAYIGLAYFHLGREDRAKYFAQEALKAGVLQKAPQEDLEKFQELFESVEGHEAYLTPLGE